ncbi:hypothetical protein Tco_1002074 [Tanacetum coccineum]|uniref:Uncharacterized protein n=1 Tax=Tanacetum coccineum TaxID=301880 RepID=A0ABQ5F5D3_9ASTR
MRYSGHTRYGKGDGDLSQSEVGDVDLSPSYGGEKVGLIIPIPSTDVKERCVSYCHGLDNVVTHLHTASVSDLGDVFEEEKDEDYESF